MHLSLKHPCLAAHQAEAVTAAVRTIAESNRIQVIMACGTGKTRVGSAFALETDPATTIVYLPSLALIRQTLPEWLKTPFPGGFDFLCVCSDQTVAQADEARVTVEELEQEFGGNQRRVTTNSEAVRDFLERACARKVLFVTYHSADVVRDGLPDGFVFDLGIYDEAHRTAGKGSRFNASLDDRHTPIGRRVFMTATPKHSDYSHRNRDEEARIVFSMDDESIYGKVAYRLSIREAINRGIIADYKVLISVITDQTIADDFKMRGLHKPDNSDQLDMGVHAMAISNAMANYGLRKAVSFHNAVKHAAAMIDPNIRNFPADLARFHVSGHQPTGERNATLARFAAAPLGLVTNARCLTEGVDVPEIDLVTFVHPRKSRVDIVQAIGRALRKSRTGNKTCGYVLLPLLVHEATRDTIQEKVLSESGYDAIWQTIQALREQDEMLDAVIREGVMTANPRGLASIIQIDGPLSQELRDYIGTVCLDELGESWDGYYGILKRLSDDGQDANVPGSTVIDGLNVGRWLIQQRQAFKAGKLSTERIARLEAIGIVWDPQEAAWEENYAILKRLSDDGQDANVPVSTVIDGMNVGGWVMTQRTRFKAGKLSTKRIARLEAIGIVWDTFEAAWEENYAILKRLFDSGQDANMPRGTAIDGMKVGAWLSQQRTRFKTGKLSPARIVRLEAIGIVWDTLESAWEENYAILKRLFDSGQDANMPRGTDIDGMNVGGWVMTQRQAFKAGQLSPERIARLEAIGIVWDPQEAAWEENYAILKRLSDDGQDANVPVSTVIDGLNVGRWLIQQRQAFKAGKLSTKRIARLEAIGIVWDTFEAAWEENYAILKRLSDDGQDANVPVSTAIDGLKVGGWLGQQRTRFKAGKLSTERIARLEAIGIVWDAQEAAWEENYAILKRLFDDGQDANVPNSSVIDGMKVGGWVMTQRTRFKAGKLSTERIARLGAIGIVWDTLEAAWEENYAILKRLFNDGLDANVPNRSVIDGLNVGGWLQHQRKAFKAGKLTLERIARLEAIGIVLNRGSVVPKQS